MTGHIYCFARRLTILVPCAVLFACANPEPGGSAASSTASSTSSSTALSGKDPIFATFVDSYFDSLYTFAPSQGTAAGFHQYDDKVEDLSAANIGRRIATLHALQSRLDSIRTRQLVLDDSIDAAMIDGAIKSELQDEELLANWKKNPMNYVGLPGNAVDLLMKPTEPAAMRIARSVNSLGGFTTFWRITASTAGTPRSRCVTDFNRSTGGAKLRFISRSTALPGSPT